MSDMDDLTTQEEEDVQDTSMDGEEAHRYGEFRDLAEKLDRVLERQGEIKDAISSLYDKLTMAPAIDAMNGDVVGDLDNDSDVDVVDLTPDFDGADLALDDIRDWE